MKHQLKIAISIITVIFFYPQLSAQISPGELTSAHSALEGISNCTKCHVLGNKVSADKCLSCHTEIRDRITAGKGYHASPEVSGKLCFSCHSEHNGKNFKLVRIDTSAFDHNLTGYQLSFPHAKADCRDCHKPQYVSDISLKARKNTFLGVDRSCLNCHADYHRQTLPGECLSCHIPEAFKPASKFNHAASAFPLKGKHKSTGCGECHKTEIIGGNKYQEFRGLQFGSCADCHRDPHKNKFGRNCGKCHTEESFLIRKSTSGFNHSNTGFPLDGKHNSVDCSACHKGKVTDPLKHDRCTACHSDYHSGEFAKEGKSPDCSECHTVEGFDKFSFTLEKHNSGPFPLKGSHVAVPCNECHKKQEKWIFRSIGNECRDCHADIHDRIIEPRFYPGGNCRACHNENSWSGINFDHSMTKFSLTGAHITQSCRACHFRPDEKGIVRQKFYELSQSCTSCHSDNHYRQFEKNGITDCTLCHSTENWKASVFNHNNTVFKLDGKHANVPCAKCHKTVREGNATFIRYKPIDYRCESCHY